ncbi:YncE family protein [Candidatus Entotheonella palauensis]|uniref:YncE family protein n=1 Tax=Candidatus Entotheonella palauensis TaxID=93172 RepID=UPI000B7F993F|nr:hypothetical protein [Candidatus Entotheonella palauensis]
MQLICSSALVWCILVLCINITASVGPLQAENMEVSLAYVANAGNNHIQVIDLASGRTLRKIYAGVTPWRLVLSPDRTRLWAQHWASETTAVIDLQDLAIARVFSARGPGAFTTKGDHFLTLNWPGSALHVIDGETFTHLDTRVTEVPKVYDLLPAPDDKTLYMVQFDPLIQDPREQFGYVVSYPFTPAKPVASFPTSHRTGPSPVHIVTPAQGVFFLTADRESNRLSLVNALGDRRAVPTCLAPRRILLSPDETRMVVLCWAGKEVRKSHLVAYRTDFTTRPWPTITQEATAELNGGLVAGRFAPSGDRLYVVDQTHRRLREVHPRDLQLLRSHTTGDVPMDVEVVRAPVRVRDRLATQELPSRQTLKTLLTRLQNLSQPFTDISWTETTTRTDDVAAPLHHEAQPAKRLKVSLKRPNRVRIETEDGRVRIAQGGTSASVDKHGRSWVAPRQDLVSVLYALPTLSVEEALRELAGDVPGSPFLRGGIAIDLITEVKEGHHRFYVIGTMTPGARVPQLWVDAETGYPTNLVERFPVIRPRGHKPQGFGGVVETKFYDFTLIENAYLMPMRLERVVDGRLMQQVRVEQIRVNTGISDRRFDLPRLDRINLQPSQELTKSTFSHINPDKSLP